MIHPDRVAIYYRTLPSSKLAEKYYMTDAAMRQWLSRNGIDSPRRIACLKVRAQIVRFRLQFGWSSYDIAEQVQKDVRYVRRVLIAVLGRIKQLVLWLDSEFRIPAPPMRVVHSQRPRPKQDCKQLSLFEWIEQHIQAA